LENSERRYLISRIQYPLSGSREISCPKDLKDSLWRRDFFGINLLEKKFLVPIDTDYKKGRGV
jgi:hypothetical protein